MQDDQTFGRVSVTRRIAVPVTTIFRVLADPGQHAALDGSGMVQGPEHPHPITAVGQVFVMRMDNPHLGAYEMDNHVVEFAPPHAIAWQPVAGRGHPDHGTADASWHQVWGYRLQPDGAHATLVTETFDCTRSPEYARADMAGGRHWIPAMTRTLEHLDEICTRATEVADRG